MAHQILTVEGKEIAVVSHGEDEFISLTDMVRTIENGTSIIENWLRNKNTLEFLSVWEEIYNSTFNSLEFEGIKSEAGFNLNTRLKKEGSQMATICSHLKLKAVDRKCHPIDVAGTLAGHRGLVASAIVRNRQAFNCHKNATRGFC